MVAWYSLMVRTLDLRSRGRWFDSQSGRSWMGDSLRRGKYITNIKVKLTFHSFGIGKSNTSCLVGVMAERVYLCRVVGR